MVVDGVPQLASGPPGSLVIGPVVRGDERAYGLEVRLEGERSFVLLLQADDDGWLVNRVDTAEPGSGPRDLAASIRLAPDGEGS